MTRRRPSARVAALPAALLAVVLTAGCTTAVAGSGRPGTAAAPSFAVTGPPFGDVGADGRAAYDEMVADMTGLAHGFTLSVGDEQSGAAASVSRYQGRDGTARVTYDGARGDVVGVDGKAWIKAPEAFWDQVPRVDAAVRPQISDRWVAVSGPLEVFLPLVDAQKLLTALDQDPVLGVVTTREGEAVQAITLGGSQVLVTLGSPHRLVQIGDDPGDSSLTFPSDDLQVEPPSDPIDYPG